MTLMFGMVKRVRSIGQTDRQSGIWSRVHATKKERKEIEGRLEMNLKRVKADTHIDIASEYSTTK